MSGLLYWIWTFFCLFGKLCLLATAIGLLVSAVIIQAACYRIIVTSVEVLYWSFETAVHPIELKQILTAQWFWRKIRLMKKFFCYFSTKTFFSEKSSFLNTENFVWLCVLWKCLFTIILISWHHCTLKVIERCCWACLMKRRI